MDTLEVQKLRTWARTHGTELTDQQVRLFHIYLKELLEWNSKINLVGVSSIDRVIRELLMDSLIPVPFLPKMGRYLDMGSGAGFPAIPLKICIPGLQADLMEPNGKKVSFLKQAIRLTGLTGIEVIQGRMNEDKGLLHPKGYHLITCRGLTDLSRVISWCTPHLMPGGIVVGFQGKAYKDVLKKSERVLKENRITLQKTFPYRLPGKGSERFLLLFEKGQ